MTNKALWDSVVVTDPKAVKPITGKQYQGNSPKPYWLIERATEVFGPVGIGWGVKVVKEYFQRLSEDDVLHVAVVSVWYVYEGVRSDTFEQMGGTKACYRTSKGTLMVDEDAGKKSVTDGMVKCLSMIGFAGDIFSGQWDDSKYVAWANDQYKGIKQAALKDIGAHLSADWKAYLEDTARVCDDLVAQGKLAEANAEMFREPMEDEAMLLYMESKMDSKTKSALRKFNEMKGK